MNSDRFDPSSFLTGMLLSVMICFLMGLFVLTQENGRWEREAVKTGNAKYNEKTATFEWVDHSDPQKSEKDE